ncbi:hypothetical protein MKW92_020760 [Papaver armeniacum]|nr:hypothetical protein MKW92_020760 [Papaver armeniacum]
MLRFKPIISFVSQQKRLNLGVLMWVCNRGWSYSSNEHGFRGILRFDLVCNQLKKLSTGHSKGIYRWGIHCLSLRAVIDDCSGVCLDLLEGLNSSQGFSEKSKEITGGCLQQQQQRWNLGISDVS